MCVLKPVPAGECNLDIFRTGCKTLCSCPPLRVNAASCVPLCTVGRENGEGYGQSLSWRRRLGLEQEQGRGGGCLLLWLWSRRFATVYGLRATQFPFPVAACRTAQRSTAQTTAAVVPKIEHNPRCQNLPLPTFWLRKQTVNTLPYSQPLPLPSCSARYSLNCNCNFVALLIVLLPLLLLFLLLLLFCGCCSAAAFDATAGSKFPLNVHFCTSF